MASKLPNKKEADEDEDDDLKDMLNEVFKKWNKASDTFVI
jgi:hypothetical protein